MSQTAAAARSGGHPANGGPHGSIRPCAPAHAHLPGGVIVRARGARPPRAVCRRLGRQAARRLVGARGHAVRAAASTAGAAASLTPCEEDPTFQCTTVAGPARSPPSRRADGEHPRRGLPAHRTARSRRRGVRDLRRAWLLDHDGPSTGSRSSCCRRSRRRATSCSSTSAASASPTSIDCPALQAGAAVSLYEDTAACHDQLGDTADLYSTTDVADDLDDVRRALGYGRIDLFGGSYAGADMITYAVRHTQHVRSVVLSSPAVVVGTDPFYAYAPGGDDGDRGQGVRPLAGVPRGQPGPGARVREGCARSAATPGSRYRRRLGGRRPTTGSRSTENLLANAIMYFNGAHFTGPGRDHPGDGRRAPRRHGAAAAAGRGRRSRQRLRQRPARVLRRPRHGCGAASTPSSRWTRAPGGATRVAQFARAYAREPDVLRRHLQAGVGASRLPRLPAVALHHAALGGPADVPRGHARQGRPDAGARRRVRPARSRGGVQARDRA